MSEKKIERALKNGFSVPDEQARESLLARCLDELGCDDEQADIDDEVLELLAAAGNPYIIPDK